MVTHTNLASKLLSIRTSPNVVQGALNLSELRQQLIRQLNKVNDELYHIAIKLPDIPQTPQPPQGLLYIYNEIQDHPLARTLDNLIRALDYKLHSSWSPEWQLTTPYSSKETLKFVTSFNDQQIIWSIHPTYHTWPILDMTISHDTKNARNSWNISTAHEAINHFIAFTTNDEQTINDWLARAQ